MTFRAGEPRPVNAGRRRGVPNKNTTQLKDAILQAATEEGNGSLTAYLRQQAREQPAAFMSLLGRVLPLQLQNDRDNPFPITEVVHLVVDTREQADAIELQALPNGTRKQTDSIEDQHIALVMAAKGKSTLGIPPKVGKEFVKADKGKKFVKKAPKAPAANAHWTAPAQDRRKTRRRARRRVDHDIGDANPTLDRAEQPLDLFGDRMSLRLRPRSAGCSPRQRCHV